MGHYLAVINLKHCILPIYLHVLQLPIMPLMLKISTFFILFLNTNIII